jgi:hypothetical protein
VASQRKLAANRCNARKSTGPRSSSGKRRSRGNSYRHGLAGSVTSSAQRSKRIERLARKIAGNATDVVVLECARDAAQAEFDLAQIRQVKVALVGRFLAFGELQAPDIESTRELIRVLKAFERGAPFPIPVEAAATMPSAEHERLAEAVRRALPELLKLDRYERRAAARRERSLHSINERENVIIQSKGVDRAKRSQTRK